MYGLATLAALAATISTAAATGSAVVKNSCDFDVYLWVVSDSSSEMQTISAGDEYSGSYETNSNGGGISIKVATDSSASSVTQFEYTVSDETIYYDLSNINGYPFEDYGVSMTPSDSSCTSVTCEAGVEECSGVYNESNDDYATLSCTTDATITVDMCLTSTSTSSSSSSSSTSSSTESSAPAKRDFVPVHSRHFHAKHHTA